MEDKESYTPEELVRIAHAYACIMVSFDNNINPLTDQPKDNLDEVDRTATSFLDSLRHHRKLIPKNIQEKLDIAPGQMPAEGICKRILKEWQDNKTSPR